MQMNILYFYTACFVDLIDYIDFLYMTEFDLFYSTYLFDFIYKKAHIFINII